MVFQRTVITSTGITHIFEHALCHHQDDGCVFHKIAVISSGIIHLFEDELCYHQDDNCEFDRNLIISQGKHTSSKMSHVSIPMTAVNSINFYCLHRNCTCVSNLTHAGIAGIAVHLHKLYRTDLYELTATSGHLHRLV